MAATQGPNSDMGQPAGKPDEEKLQKSVVAARKVVEAQEAAASLKDRALQAINPKERLKLLQEAYDKEMEACRQSKYAQRLQSGAWQGTIAGGGIGAGVALGLGTVVGTLVSGLLSVPTVALGSLVGAGVGSIHGPFLRFDKKDGKKAAMTEEESRTAAMKEAQKLDEAVERGANTVPQPPQLEDFDTNGLESSATHEIEQANTKKKPRKLQVRSGNDVEPLLQKRKPRKIQVRSTMERSESY